MNDILLALLLGGGVSLGLDALDTERYLAGPATLDVSVGRELRRRSTFCNDPTGLAPHISVTQPLVRFANERIEVYAHYSHDSCLLEQEDRSTSDVLGLGVSVQLNFF